MKVDLCDLKRLFRADFFAKDRDITLQSDRILVLGDGTVVDTALDAQFVTLAASSSLANERILTGGTAISVADGGAGGNATANHDQVAVGDLHTEYIQKATLTAKGDIIAATAAATPAAVNVGSDGEVLIADSAQATGMTWSSAPNGWIPIGGIIFWSIGSGYLPANWQVCDGTNGTPNLRDKFIVGAGSSYAVGDTGGSDTSDLSHTHGPGTLGTDTYANHTHTSGSYAAANDTHSHDVAGTSGGGSDHTHGDGSYTAANDAHNHTFGTLATDSDEHNHGAGTLFMGGPSVNAGVTAGASDRATDVHTHTMGGATATDTHSHSVTSGTVANDTHNHDVTGTSAIETSHTHSSGSYAAANDTHNHDVAGTSGGGGSHSHSVDSGATASDGVAAHDNRPQFYAAYYVMRMS